MIRIAYTVIRDFQVMLFGGISVFELANQTVPTPVYELVVLSELGGWVRTSLGISVDTKKFGMGHLDTVIACAGFDEFHTSIAVQSFFRKLCPTLGESDQCAPEHLCWLRQVC